MSDDGRGLALKKLKEKAIAAGLLDASKAASASDIAELIFHSGMSTADSVTDISGRGVGMDAIRQFVEKAGGKIEIRLGQGAKDDADFVPFSLCIKLPATNTRKVA
jgi:two-component system chemotaxis sensor kinase CheA